MYKKAYLIVFIFLAVFTAYSNSIYTYLERADKSFMQQNYYKAIENYKEALKINTNDINSNKGLSNSFYMLGEFNESLLYVEKCISLNRNDIELLNLKARILTALELYSDAEKQYLKVLEKEMFNVEAQSGLAELKIVNGDLKGSLREFEKLLKFSPNSRRLLLSLVVLNDQQGNYTLANEYIQKSIRLYPVDPVVLEAAVRHYMLTKSYDGALIYMDELSRLSENQEIKLLNAELLIYLDRLEDSLEIISDYMKVVKDNPEAYYLATVVLNSLDDKEKALSIIKRGIDLKPDEELFRFYREMILNNTYTMKDQKRSDISNWYLNQGKLLENRFFYEKAKTYYLRGIDLNPFDKKLRQAYAGVLKKLGFKKRYIKELELIQSQNEVDKEIADTILIENSLPIPKIYEKWGEEQWTNNNLFSITMFIDNSSGEYHLNSSEIIRDISSRFLSGHSKFFCDNIEIYNGNYSEAFNNARSIDSDYFILLSFFEGTRTFSLKASLHLTKSGREIRTFNYLKTGNNRIFNTFDNFSKDLNNFLPTLGTVIDIIGNDVLLDIGIIHSIEAESEFDVIKKDSFVLSPVEPFILFEKDKHLGSLIILDVGEGMSSGEFTPDSSFNLLNIGDNVILKDNSEESQNTNDEKEKNITDNELILQLLRVN